MEACERISHIFYVLLAQFAWNLDLFPRAPCSSSHLPLCVATVHGGFWPIFLYFLREKWTPNSLTQFSPWKFEHYFHEQYLAVTACVSLRCFWKNFTYFHRDGGLGLLRAVRTKIGTLFFHAVRWRSEGFSAVLTQFSRSSGLSRS